MNRDVAQSINDATRTKIAVDTVEYDNCGMADITTNDRFDILRDGQYQITCHYDAGTGNDGATHSVYIYYNAVATRVNSTNNLTTASASTFAELNETMDLSAE